MYNDYRLRQDLNAIFSMLVHHIVFEMVFNFLRAYKRMLNES